MFRARKPVKSKQSKPVALDCALGGKLTEREKWLMQKAFVESIWYCTLDEWLEDYITDGVTVEMELVKEAP